MPDVSWVDIDSITPWDKNPRINDHAVDDVVKSITRFGWSNPIIVRKADKVVIAGHTRLKAAQKMGLDKVLVREMDLDPAQAAALALADNKLNEIADWDDESLGEILLGLEQENFDLDGLGFSDDEIKTLTASVDDFDEEWGAALNELPEGDRAPIQTMSFTLHDDQVEIVKDAIRRAKDLGDFGDTGNSNGNGNAIARICEMFSG